MHRARDGLQHLANMKGNKVWGWQNLPWQMAVRLEW